MVDDSINMMRDVERHFALGEQDTNDDIETFINLVRSGKVNDPCPFSACKGSIADMMHLSLAAPSKVGAVSINDVFALLGKLSKEDDEAFDMVEKMARQFIWVAK